ncbi:VacJ family lipoprotein [Neiella marina]|uniref:VacJ family lipoprotein n=1 Tax=Neiella holothuriorum TaxID=2870530 RepID=A0ABS7EDQ6_9GAMM|nr:VacJ family lipoprotein [Neiella holothuriorum]MBW8190472.1 VacJ family lipoprotein [Neiella holothuriorum]
MKQLNHVRNLVMATAAVLLTACSATPDLEPDAKEPRLAHPDTSQMDPRGIGYVDNDPWEGFNRRMYYFNAKADEYVLLPAVSGYEYITPEIMQTGVNNFFSNLGEVSTFLNSLFQLKGERAVTTAFRFVTNSTIGIFGLFDPATAMGVYKEREDFGQTLGYWGVGDGPYLVLPFLGPSSARDGFGLLVDSLVYNELIDEMGLKSEEEFALFLLRSINARKQIPFRYYATGSAFEYELIRFLYFRARTLQIQR